MMLISAMTCVYYNVIVMYSLLYICLSMGSIGWNVPWAICREAWKTDSCRDTPLPDLNAIADIAERIDTSLGEFSYEMGLDPRNPGPEVIKSFFMLNSAEHKIHPDHKC